MKAIQIDPSRKLKELRLKKNLTQEDLASELSTNRTTISHIERGDILPSTELLISYSRYFEESIDSILDIRKHESFVIEEAYYQGKSCDEIENEIIKNEGKKREVESQRIDDFSKNKSILQKDTYDATQINYHEINFCLNKDLVSGCNAILWEIKNFYWNHILDFTENNINLNEDDFDIFKLILNVVFYSKMRHFKDTVRKFLCNLPEYCTILERLSTLNPAARKHLQLFLEDIKHDSPESIEKGS